MAAARAGWHGVGVSVLALARLEPELQLPRLGLACWPARLRLLGRRGDGMVTVRLLLPLSSLAGSAAAGRNPSSVSTRSKASSSLSMS